MFKKVTLALVTVVLLASNAVANDDLFNELADTKGSNVADASIEIEDFNMDIDVDQLAENAGDEETDAIEACFRRFGYHSYGHCGWYRPCYSYYNCYSHVYCRPIYHTYTTYCAPVISHYWGCY